MSLVLIKVAAEHTGLTVKAIRRKIEDGKWLQGREYHRAPDGGIFIDMEAVHSWIKGVPRAQAQQAQSQASTLGRPASDSNSLTRQARATALR